MSAIQASVLQNLRLALHRQIRRHSIRRSTFSFDHPLGHLWSHLFHGGRQARGHAPLLDPTRTTQITVGLHSYRTVGDQNPQERAMSGLRDEVNVESYCCTATEDQQSFTAESPVSPPSLQSVYSQEEEELSPVSSDDNRVQWSEPPTPCQCASSAHSRLPFNALEACVLPYHRRASNKLVLELVANLKAITLRRYSSLRPLSPVSPSMFTSNSQTPSIQPHPQCSEVTSPMEPLSSPVKAEDSDCRFTVVMPSSRKKRRNERKTGRKSRFRRTLSDEGGDSGWETLC